MRRRITDAGALPKKLHPTRQRRFLTGVLIVTFSILMSAAITAPFFYSNRTQSRPVEIRQTKDMGIHLAVMEQFDKVLRSGSVYPRWLPDINYGYGNAWPNFYQPGFYYLTSLGHAVTDDWVHTLFAITALGLFASGLAFYVLARLFFGKPASAAAAAVYTLLPYHLLDVFVRGALPEYLSFVLLPLILYFFYRLGNEGRARYYAGLGVCYGACLMIHIPIAYLLSFIIVIYALVWSAAQRDWRIALRISLGMAIGVLLSAVYWIPAVSEIKYAVETVTTLFRYDQNYISLLYADSYGEVLRETFAVQALALLIVIASVLWLKLSESRRLKSSLAPAKGGTPTGFLHESVWIGMGVLSLFMNLPVSYYVARLIPRINVVAFPYRWLVFVCLFTALVTAALIDRLHGRIREAGRTGLARLSPEGRMVLAPAVAILALNVWFSAHGVVIASLSSPMITREVNFLCDTYCPAGAPPAGKLPLTERIVIESSSGRSDILEWSPLFRKAVVTTDEPTIARFKTFRFPGWTARIDGADVEIFSDPIEAQVINVPRGEHTVEITYGSTPARNLGAVTSVSGLFLVFILMLSDGLRLGRRQSP